MKEHINTPPFEATHACCIGQVDQPESWQLATPEDDPCFINPEPGCYGNFKVGEPPTQDILISSVSDTRSYVWETQVQLCDGNRGNVCNGEFANTLYREKLWCGTRTSGCEYVDDKCQNVPAFSFVENEGWCSGRMGCEDICTEFVYDYARSEFPLTIAGLATEQWLDSGDPDIENYPGFPFHCGCTAGDDGNVCDGDNDGSFNDVCFGGECLPQACSRAEGERYCDREGERIVECIEDGTRIVEHRNCRAEGARQFCSEGEETQCLPWECEPDAGPFCFNELNENTLTIGNNINFRIFRMSVMLFPNKQITHSIGAKLRLLK